MSRHGPLIAHLLALPLGLLLALVTGLLNPFSSVPAVHIQVDDTMFIVSHIHPALVLGACLAVASFVARRWGRFNAVLLAGWGFLLLCLLPSVLIANALQSLPDPTPDTVTMVVPTDPTLGYLSFATACASLLALVAGLCISFARRPRLERSRIGDTGAGS